MQCLKKKEEIIMKNRPEFLILLNELENRLKKCNVEMADFSQISF